MPDQYSVDEILEELRQKRPSSPAAQQDADARKAQPDPPIAAVARAVESDLSAARILDPIRPEEPHPNPPTRRGESPDLRLDFPKEETASPAQSGRREGDFLRDLRLDFPEEDASPVAKAGSFSAQTNRREDDFLRDLRLDFPEEDASPAAKARSFSARTSRPKDGLARDLRLDFPEESASPAGGSSLFSARETKPVRPAQPKAAEPASPQREAAAKNADLSSTRVMEPVHPAQPKAAEPVSPQREAAAKDADLSSTRVMEPVRPAQPKAAEPQAAPPAYPMDDSIDITALFAATVGAGRRLSDRPAGDEPPAAAAPAEAEPAAAARPAVDRGEKMPFIVTIDEDNEDDLSSLLPPEEPAPTERERRAAEKKAARMEKAESRRKKKEAAVPEAEEAPSLSIAPDATEYRTAQDVHTVRDELAYLHRTLRTRLVVVGICFALSLYLSLCNLYPLPLFTAVCPETNMTAYLVVCLAPLFLAAAFSYPVLGNGVISLFTRRAGHDTPAALCVFAVLAHTIALLASGSFSVARSDLYPAVAVLTLAANAFGKLRMVRRIECNFAVLTSGDELIGENLLRGGELAERLTGLHGEEDLALVYPARIGFAENFLSQSYSEDYSERMCRVAAPLMLIFSALSSLLCWLVFKQGPLGGVTVFCAMLCMSSALSETLVGNLPLWRAAKALTQEGAIITGYAVTDELGEMDAAAVDACELYPAGAAVLHGIKAFRQDRIDSAIVDAASVLNASDGVLRDVFLETIGGRSELLRPVSRLSYEQGEGLCAEVDGRKVLLGSRDLLLAHGVPVISADVEAKYVKEGRAPLYLAEDGEPTALFVVGYRVSKHVANKLHALAKKGIRLVVHSTDPNLTPERLERDFGYPAELAAFVPPSLRGEYLDLCRPRERAQAGALSVRGSRVRLRLLAALHTLRASIRLGTLIQTAGLLFGYALTALLAFFGSVGSLGFVQILLYQFFWLAAAIGLPALMRF